MLKKVYFTFIILLLSLLNYPIQAQGITIQAAKTILAPENNWVEVARFTLGENYSVGSATLQVSDLAADLGNKASYEINIAVNRLTTGATAQWNYTSSSMHSWQSSLEIYQSGNTISVYQYNGSWGSRVNFATITGLVYRASTTVTLYPVNASGTYIATRTGTKLEPVLPVTFHSGNILIGKTTQTNATYKLDVAGDARADKIVVNTNGADFVFEKDYSLKPLAEVEQFIKANHHLPEIPSAADMQTNGVSLGELNTKLLQKIEELTLYVIEQQKQMLNIRQELENLKANKKKLQFN